MMEGHAALGRFIQATFTILCYKCGCEGIYKAESHYGAVTLFCSEGWQVIREQPLCKDCAAREK